MFFLLFLVYFCNFCFKNNNLIYLFHVKYCFEKINTLYALCNTLKFKTFKLKNVCQIRTTYEDVCVKHLTGDTWKTHKLISKDMHVAKLWTKRAIINIHFQVKTHLQSKAAQDIAVGYQHAHESMSHGLLSIYRTSGITGMWRGAHASVIKVMIGSAVQLTTFSFTRQYIIGKKVSSFTQHK